MSKRKVWIARGIAVAVDAVQIALPALFAEGFLAPFDPVLDLATAIIMISLPDGISRLCPHSSWSAFLLRTWHPHGRSRC
jgi:hypothetical protein